LRAAMSRASVTSSVRMCAAIDQPITSLLGSSGKSVGHGVAG
jgi:hypothetical protein